MNYHEHRHRAWKMLWEKRLYRRVDALSQFKLRKLDEAHNKIPVIHVDPQGR